MIRKRAKQLKGQSNNALAFIASDMGLMRITITGTIKLGWAVKHDALLGCVRLLVTQVHGYLCGKLVKEEN